MSSERPAILMVRRGAFLAPLGPVDASAIERLPSNGKALKVKVTQPRSGPQHRLYWTIIGLVADNLEDVSEDTLHDVIKLRCGYAKAVKTRRGIEYVPASIAWDKMPQDEFNVFFEKAMRFICDDVIPGMSRPALEREARELLGAPA